MEIDPGDSFRSPSGRKLSRLLYNYTTPSLTFSNPLILNKKIIEMFSKSVVRSSRVLARGFASSARAERNVAVLGAAGMFLQSQVEEWFERSPIAVYAIWRILLEGDREIIVCSVIIAHYF